MKMAVSFNKQWKTRERKQWRKEIETLENKKWNHIVKNNENPTGLVIQHVPILSFFK